MTAPDDKNEKFNLLVYQKNVADILISLKAQKFNSGFDGRINEVAGVWLQITKDNPELADEEFTGKRARLEKLIPPVAK